MATVIVVVGVRVIVRMVVCGILVVAVAACVPVAVMVMLMGVVVSMTTFGALACVIMPRFDCIARRRARARRRRVQLTGTRPKTLRQRAPRQENMNHGRILPKVTESLDSL
ncbi:hypothetical protein [Paraburkholderia bannensis]|uniref:hypothetical protein n=1 Tax=Paraburkholderia bannensis TaxID=765414 RepID=UPI003899505A